MARSYRFACALIAGLILLLLPIRPAAAQAGDDAERSVALFDSVVSAPDPAAAYAALSSSDAQLIVDLVTPVAVVTEYHLTAATGEEYGVAMPDGPRTYGPFPGAGGIGGYTTESWKNIYGLTIMSWTLNFEAYADGTMVQTASVEQFGIASYGWSYKPLFTQGTTTPAPAWFGNGEGEFDFLTLPFIGSFMHRFGLGKFSLYGNGFCTIDGQGT